MGRRLFAIDDDKTFLMLLKKGLVDRGYEVESATDSRDGIRKIEEYQPEAILLDCVMPGLDGVDTLQMVKGNPFTWKIPVIMLTGKQDPHNIIHSMQSGATAYVKKHPTDFTVTLDQIEEAISALPSE